jgi:predicted XRE-type DNA-binding protein
MTDNKSQLTDELVAIKRLLIFALLQQPGVTQAQIATALGTSQSQISKMLGAGIKAK